MFIIAIVRASHFTFLPNFTSSSLNGHIPEVTSCYNKRLQTYNGIFVEIEPYPFRMGVWNGTVEGTTGMQYWNTPLLSHLR